MQGSQWYRKVGRIFFSNHNPLKDIYYAFEKKRVVNQCLRSFSGCKLKFGGTHAGCKRVRQDEQCRLPPAGAPQASLRSRLPATPQPRAQASGKGRRRPRGAHPVLTVHQGAEGHQPHLGETTIYEHVIKSRVRFHSCPVERVRKRMLI